MACGRVSLPKSLAGIVFWILFTMSRTGPPHVDVNASPESGGARLPPSDGPWSLVAPPPARPRGRGGPAAGGARPPPRPAPPRGTPPNRAPAPPRGGGP